MNELLNLIQTVLTPDNLKFLGEGLILSIKFSIIVIFGSLALGIILALTRNYAPKSLKILSVCYVELFRNTPLLLWILFARFTLPKIFNISAFQAIVITFIFFCASGLSEIIRGGLKAIGKGQFEAAQSQGFTFVQTIMYIILPQTIKLVIPQLLQTIITIFKDSSYLSTIGVVDFMYQGRRLMAHFFQADQIMFIFVYMAGIYFIINFGLSLVVRHMTSKKREAKKRMKLSRKLQTV